jgi:hypothetical protein
LGTIDVLSYTARSCRQKWFEWKDISPAYDSTAKTFHLFCYHVRPDLKTLKYDLDIIASQCILYPCLKNYQANITARILSEKVVSTVPAPRFSLDNGYIAIQIPCFIGGQQYDFSNFSLVPQNNQSFVAYNRTGTFDPKYMIPTECFYTMDKTYALAFMQFFELAVNGTGGADLLQRSPWGTANNITDNLLFGDNWWLPSLYHSGNATLESISAVFDKVGNAFTNYIRSSAVTGEGRFQYSSYTRQAEFAYSVSCRTGVCTKFDWKWLLFPAVLLFGTLTVFLYTVLISYNDPDRLPIWRSSLLPLLYYHLQGQRNDSTIPTTPQNARSLMASGHVLETAELQDFASKHLVTFNRTEIGAGFHDVETWNGH